MQNKEQHITFANAFADIFEFDNNTEVREYHVMIHASSPRHTFGQQLEAVLDAYGQMLEGPLKGAQAVFKRFFLSDAANPADEVVASDVTDCAKSMPYSTDSFTVTSP